MTESISQKASLVAQVIEDVSYEPFANQQFQAELVGTGKEPHYKDSGYFAFSDLVPGDYQLRIVAERFQTQQLPITIPSAPIVFVPGEKKLPKLLERIVFDQPGDNELVVVVKTVNAPGKLITFDAVTLPRPINVGALVLVNGSKLKLDARLDAGTIASARLDSVAGVAPDAIVRIVRDRSIRLRFDPYYPAPAELTRIVGAVSLKNQPGVPLENALVRITKVDGKAVTVADVSGARIASVLLGGNKVILGTESDIQTTANARGDYNLYFRRADFPNVTLEASLTGFKKISADITINPLARNPADFELEKT